MKRPTAPLFRIVAAAAMLIPAGLAVHSQTGPVHAARSCPTVSGYIYHDANDNGLRDPGEAALGSGAMELRASNGTVVASTVADPDGYYEFFFDRTRQAAETSSGFAADFPATVTNWTDSKHVPGFDAEDGTLVSVVISQTASITSSIAAESLGSEVTSLTATVSGNAVVAIGQHSVLVAPSLQAGQFAAQPYDGTSDFAGLSGHDFGTQTASAGNTLTVTGSSIDAFYGPEPVVISATVDATSNTSGSGNALSLVATDASVDVTLTYRFVPYACLTGQSYTIVQLEQPAGYVDGRETAGNETPIPGTDHSDAISITVGAFDLPNNNFGESTGSLAGHVYVDLDDDGNFDISEPPIPGVEVRLVGLTETGATIDAAMETLADGSYLFGGLLAGKYEIAEVQPAAYVDGKDTIGSQGGETATDDFSIVLLAGVHGVENNFAELLPPTATATKRLGTVFPSLTPTPDGTLVPERDFDRDTSGTPGAPDAGGGLAIVGGSGINVLLGVIFVLAIGGGVLTMMLGRSEPAPRR